jgi:OmpA-OmpF porin, OOP family
MKKILMSFLLFSFITTETKAQGGQYISPRSIGVSFFVNDYATPQRIRTSSFTSVIGEKRWAKFRETSPGIAISFHEGLRNHVDFVGTLAGSFVQIDIPNETINSDQFLLEADASFNLKMFPNNFFFTPYLNAGVGLSYYNNKLGGFLPLGGGLSFNLFNESKIFINSQYRVPVSTNFNNYHFFHSIGIAGIIGSGRSANNTGATQ